MNIETARLLLTEPGWKLLGGLPPYDPAQTERLNRGLRSAGVSPELAAALLTQQELRHRAHEKFGRLANTLLLTRRGLEQATRHTVAAHHARRYRDAGITELLDLTCGLGADAMACATLGLRVQAFDTDEVTAAFATVNLRHFPGSKVIHGDGVRGARDYARRRQETPTPESEAADAPATQTAATQTPTAQPAGCLKHVGVFADPGRRNADGRREYNPANYQPPLPDILELAATYPALGVKVAPGIPYEHIPRDAHAQWVSVAGQVVEAGLWFGPLAPGGPGRSALLIDADGQSHTLYQEPAEGSRCAAPQPPESSSSSKITDPRSAPEQAPTGPLEAYISQPDGAAIRAGLIAQLARQHGAHLLHPSIAYLTSSTAPVSPWLQTWRITHVTGAHVKNIRAHTTREGIGTLEIRKRGMDIDPAALRKKLKLRGPASATLFLTRLGQRRIAIFAQETPPGTQRGRQIEIPGANPGKVD